MEVISRARWGFSGWNGGPPPTVPRSSRTHFVVHYHGGPVGRQTGPAVPQGVDDIHKNNGWKGVGYNFLIDMSGNVYEGRGLDYLGSHCPSRNADGYGVYVAVGAKQHPSTRAYEALTETYEWLCRTVGRPLTVGCHSDYYNTDCPGPVLTPWVKSGMINHRKENPRMTPEQAAQLARVLQVCDDSIEPAAVENRSRLASIEQKIDERLADLARRLDELAARG